MSLGQNMETAVEGFILKWTFITVFVGVIILFLLKILMLVSLYVTSGKLIQDFGNYIWEGIKAVVGF